MRATRDAGALAQMRRILGEPPSGLYRANYLLLREYRGDAFVAAFTTLKDHSNDEQPGQQAPERR